MAQKSSTGKIQDCIVIESPRNFARRAGLLQLSPGCNAVPWEGAVSPRVSFKRSREDDAPQKIIIHHQHNT